MYYIITEIIWCIPIPPDNIQQKYIGTNLKVEEKEGSVHSLNLWMDGGMRGKGSIKYNVSYIVLGKYNCKKIIGAKDIEVIEVASDMNIIMWPLILDRRISTRVYKLERFEQSHFVCPLYNHETLYIQRFYAER